MGNFDFRVPIVFCFFAGSSFSFSLSSKARFLDDSADVVDAVLDVQVGIPEVSRSSALMPEMSLGIGVRVSMSEEILEKSDEAYEATHPAIATRSLGS